MSGGKQSDGVTSGTGPTEGGSEEAFVNAEWGVMAGDINGENMYCGDGNGQRVSSADPSLESREIAHARPSRGRSY